MPLELNVIQKKRFCVLQKKVLSFGPNRTVEVQPHCSAEPNVGSVTSWLVLDAEVRPKIQQTKMLVTCQRFGELFLFGLVWQYSSVQSNYNKGRFKVMATY
jgi:hypothetical protein